MDSLGTSRNCQSYLELGDPWGMVYSVCLHRVRAACPTGRNYLFAPTVIYNHPRSSKLPIATVPALTSLVMPLSNHD